MLPERNRIRGVFIFVKSFHFRNHTAEWRMVLGGMFEFLELYFDGDVDIFGEQGLRRLVSIGYRKPFGRFEHR